MNVSLMVDAIYKHKMTLLETCPDESTLGRLILRFYFGHDAMYLRTVCLDPSLTRLENVFAEALPG